MKQRSEGRKPAHFTEPVILFGVGDSTFAIAATEVDEICAADGLKPLAGAAICGVPKVRHRLVRGGRSCCVVDANLYFRMLPSDATRVLVLRNYDAAVLVGHIDRMAEIDNLVALPPAFCGEERNWYRGLTVLNAVSGMPVVTPVVKAENFLSQAELTLLESLEPRRSKRAAKV